MRTRGPIAPGSPIVRVLALALLAGAAACAPAARPAAPASAPAAPAAAAQPAAAQPAAAPRLETVSVLLDWFPDGYHSPFYVAREKGYYREAGLEVEIHEGKGSGNVAQLVGTKNATFGFAEGAAVAKAIGRASPSAWWPGSSVARRSACPTSRRAASAGRRTWRGRPTAWCRRRPRTASGQPS